MVDKRKVILDVDTGTDDATAIILAALTDKIDLIALTTVWGNKPISITTKQTLMITELVKKDIPVYAGCHCAMTRDLYKIYIPTLTRIGIDENGVAFGYHDEFRLPEPTIKAKVKHAVQFIIDTCRESQKKSLL
jgi:inosine-uridine nucleoside N-ribohydrolase